MVSLVSLLSLVSVAIALPRSGYSFHYGHTYPQQTTHQQAPQQTAAKQTGFDINEMLQQVNQVRARVGAGPLRINEKLMLAAQRHSQDQAAWQNMSHSSSDGSDVGDRAQRVGYNYRALAENVAWNQRSVSEVMEAWINSPGHYANLINPQYSDFGAGMVNYYWTQNFGKSQ